MALFFRPFNKKASQPSAEPTAAAPEAAGQKPVGDHYVPGDALPVPDAIEKDSESVWAMWHDAVSEPAPETQAPAELIPDLFQTAAATAQASADEPFLKTIPLDLRSMAPSRERLVQDSQETVPATLLMDLPEAGEKPKR